MDDYILISSLNQYAYCPRSAWYQCVSGQFEENADTVEGALLHERAHSSVRTVLDGVIQIRTVYLYSDTYGLSGIADLVEQKQRDLYPVEYKKGQEGDWKNHQIQLCAQALCLEEMLRLRRNLRHGYLYYVASGTRRKVRFTRRLRKATIRTAEAVRTLLRADRPPPARYGPKCCRCSCYPICLPQEIALIIKHQRRR